MLVAVVLALPGFCHSKNVICQSKEEALPNFLRQLKHDGFIPGSENHGRKFKLPPPVETSKPIPMDQSAISDIDKATNNNFDQHSTNDMGLLTEANEPKSKNSDNNGPRIVDKTWEEIRSANGLSTE